MIEPYAVFILTHNRVDNIKTLRTLTRCGYTGPVYLVVDNLDPSLEEYKQRYGDQIVTFDKHEWAAKTDAQMNGNEMRAVVFARNAVFELARQCGFAFFVVLDDDYEVFEYRFSKSGKYNEHRIQNLDAVFDSMMEFYQSAKTIRTLAMSQNGDWQGGEANPMAFSTYLRRKAMNVWFMSVGRPVAFTGLTNEDATAYAIGGTRGELFLQTHHVSVKQVTTQVSTGGLTDIYLDQGTYIKSMYSVMVSPSNVRVQLFPKSKTRLHHKIDWNRTAVQIVSESLRKA